MPRFRNFVTTALALAGLWWLLTDNTPGSWLIGVPVVLAASWSARCLGSDERNTISYAGVLRFVPVFVWESLRGGIDVAWRTLAPRMRIQPGYTRYRTLLPQTNARVLFANCVCLLPGTLAADLHGDLLEVHMLDRGVDPGADLRRLETAVARIYRQEQSQRANPGS